MKKASKKATKQKLKTLEWTDEAIEECSSAGPEYFKKYVDTDERKLEDITTMESKIARVQLRKKESEERELRRLKKLANNTDEIKTEFQFDLQPKSSDEVNARALVHSLNTYFDERLQQSDLLINVIERSFPLNTCDSTIFDESLMFNAPKSTQGACLLPNFENQDHASRNGLGKWIHCTFLYEEEDSLIVRVHGSIVEETLRVSRYQVCLLYQDHLIYVNRVESAILSRKDNISSMRYFALVKNMPVFERVTSTMTQAQYERIYTKAASTKRLLLLDSSIAQENIEEARGGFEFTMNKILFDSNLLARKNRNFFQSLGLSKTIFQQTVKVPYYGLVELPSYPLKARTNHHRLNSFLGSLAAVSSLQDALRENLTVENILVMRISYNKPFALDRFERFLNDQLLGAIRAIKQEWPVKTGQAVRQSITKHQDHFPQEQQKQAAAAGTNYNTNQAASTLNASKKKVTINTTPLPMNTNNTNNGSPTNSQQLQQHQQLGLYYDCHLRNVYEFDKSNNPIKFFLERINFMMSDVLKHIITRSLIAYATDIEDLCSCEVTVEDVRTIKVFIPPQSIYKRKALPPLFQVAFRIASDDKLLNGEEVENSKKEIAIWMKSKEAENGDKCPFTLIQPRYGKSFEYSQSPEEFRDVIMKGFKIIVNEFLDVPHLQKFVMERIYFPVSRFIESIALELPWVAEASTKLQKTVEKALQPLHQYLHFFKKYENFVNIDITAYIAGRIHAQQKDPENSEIELPVTVNLSQISSVIDEHMETIQEIEQSLPIQPIECGLFLIDVVSVRNLLLDKHRLIIRTILSAHADRCSGSSEYLEEEFKKINKNLSKRPENIEQLVELEEYIVSLPNSIQVLQGCIQEMMNYYDLLENTNIRSI